MTSLNWRFLIFFGVITAVLSLLSFYLGTRILSRFQWAAENRFVVWLSLTIFVFLQILGPLLYQLAPNVSNRPFILQWLVYTTLGLFASVLIFALITDVGFWVWSKISSVPVDAERRALLGIGALSVASVGVGTWQALRGPQIFEVDIPIKDLPGELNGYRILQISDLHVGPLIDRDYVENVVEMAAHQQADLIVVTGDLVDGTVENLSPHVEPLRKLNAKDGVFYITGNHEYYWNAGQWIEKIKELGGTVLLNEHKLIERGNAKLALGGVPDLHGRDFFSDHACDPKKAFENCPSDALKVLLAHQPSSYKLAEGTGIHLQVSGHTHGGQFFPWNLIVKLAQRYYIGLNRHEDFWIYVNRGTGWWGPPHRFGVSCEVSVLKIVRA